TVIHQPIAGFVVGIDEPLRRNIGRNGRGCDQQGSAREQIADEMTVMRMHGDLPGSLLAPSFKALSAELWSGAAPGFTSPGGESGFLSIAKNSGISPSSEQPSRPGRGACQSGRPEARLIVDNLSPERGEGLTARTRTAWSGCAFHAAP